MNKIVDLFLLVKTKLKLILFQITNQSERKRSMDLISNDNIVTNSEAKKYHYPNN